MREWEDSGLRCLGMWFATTSEAPEMLLLFNAAAQGCPFAIPPGRWHVQLDTAHDVDGAPDVALQQGSYLLPAHSVALLMLAAPSEQATRAPAMPGPSLSDQETG